MKLMTEQQIEQLAREHTQHLTGSQSVSLTYLRAVVIAVQAQLGKPRGRKPISAQSQLEALQRVETPYYAAVCRGVITEDIMDTPNLSRDERRLRMLTRNSRSNFARTAKSTVVHFIQAGGDIRTVDAELVSKDQLRRQGKPAEPENRIERQIIRNSEALQRSIQRQAKGDPDAARATIEALMEDLQALLNDLPNDAEAPTRVAPAVAPRGDRSHARTRVGVPTWHHAPQPVAPV